VISTGLKKPTQEQLLKLLFEAEAELKVAELRTKTREAEIAKLNKTVAEKDDYISWLLKALMGPTSERRSWDSLSPELQLWLEGMALDLPKSPPPSGKSVKKDEEGRRKNPTSPGKSKARYGPRATVIDFELPVPGTEGVPADQLELVETKITEKVVRVESPYCIVRVHQNVYRIKGCLEELHPEVFPEVIPGSIFDVSVLAGMAVDKYHYHLPIYRQHLALKNADIFVDRGNMIRLLHRTAELLEPIYEALMSSVLNSSLLTIDETPTPAGRKKGKMGKGYFWVFYGDQREVYFLFSPSRARAVLDGALSVFKGQILCDGYVACQSYVNATEGNTLCQCWGHTRREFLKAEKREPEPTKWVLRQIKAMYEIDEQTRGKPLTEIFEIRQTKMAPLVTELFRFLKKTIAEETFVPTDSFLKAAGYALNREVALKVFLGDPSVPMDTNHVERELRGQAVGRKNWMFHVTEEGARHAAIFYSLIRSCVLCDINPMTYLVDVLQRLDTHPDSKKEMLIPRLWKEHFEKEPLRSPFHKVLLPSRSIQP